MTITMKSIAAAVAERHGLRLRDLVGSGRTRHLSYARHEAMWEMRQVETQNGRPRYSLQAVGQFFNRDHTTVVYAERQHPKRVGNPVTDVDASTGTKGVIPIHQTCCDAEAARTRIGSVA